MQSRTDVKRESSLGCQLLHNEALQLTLCCSNGSLPQGKSSYESAAEFGFYAAAPYAIAWQLALREAFASSNSGSLVA